ncbi:MAG: hypothetical protein ACE5NW_01380 [Acidiferrobacterales bacterium]
MSLDTRAKWGAARKAYARAISARGLDKKLAQYVHQRPAFTKTEIK